MARFGHNQSLGNCAQNLYDYPCQGARCVQRASAMNQRSAVEELQRELCRRLPTEFFAAPPACTLGIALNVRDGILPINGLRHPPSAGTSGWYIWAGEEFSTEADFFKPLHIEHLDGWAPEIKKYLGLPPGWRFLIAPGYEDIWFDEKLLRLDGE
ncbi:hypothetical protein [Variovorax sp. Varisp36]|uniref:immunity protein Imm33 domain-containing protein n=1 Tax=Variovorax sp. Varisp36 TaxID=3243031 RepID=UPI0039A6F87D